VRVDQRVDLARGRHGTGHGHRTSPPPRARRTGAADRSCFHAASTRPDPLQE
jgi:hypothetical protein